MAKTDFDYSAAKKAGYSDDEIMNHLSQIHPTFDVQAATESGYTPAEINSYLSSYKPEKSFGQKAARIGMQLGLGAAENALLPYELGVALPLSTKGFHTNLQQQRYGEDIEYLYEKNMGKPVAEWSPEDQELLKSFSEHIENPKKIEEEVEPINIGVRSLFQKATGIETHPEGFLEKAASWYGFIKDPKKYVDLYKTGFKPKELFKMAIPGTDEIRSATAGAALQMAEDNKFGPVGTLAAAVIGDVFGHGPAGIKYVYQNPQKVAAEVTNFFTRANSKAKNIEQLVKDANSFGIQLDAGTLTGSNIVKLMQAKLSQSGLTGEALDEARKTLSGSIMREYSKLADALGESSISNEHQAAEEIKNALKVSETNLNIPKSETREARSLQGRVSVEERPAYQQILLNQIAPTTFENSLEGGNTIINTARQIKEPIKEQFNEAWGNFNREIETINAPQPQLAEDLRTFVNRNRGSLLLGESAPESRVLRAAEVLLNRLEQEGAYTGINLGDLVKTKRTLGDVANWEFGGSNFESAYKKLVADVDQAIDRTLQNINPALREQFEHLNEGYSNYKQVFENKNSIKLFEERNPNIIGIYENFVRNPDKLRALEEVLIQTPEGQAVLSRVKRDFAQREISKPNLTDRDISNMNAVLGPQYNDAVANFVRERQHQIDHPLPRAAPQQRLGITAQLPGREAASKGVGRPVKQSDVMTRRKMYEYLNKKSPEQIMKMMDTVDSIRKLRRALELTPDGKKLFEELARYKLDEMITKKMQNSAIDQLKIGKFSTLLDKTKDASIVKELVGPEAFERLKTLQKISGKLQNSASKFFNASQSGSTAADIALASTFAISAFTLNPWMFLSTAGTLAGMKIATNLLADPLYLKYLEQAILAGSKAERFMKILNKMRPQVDKAFLEAEKSQINEK